jgi:hypothetical protein
MKQLVKHLVIRRAMDRNGVDWDDYTDIAEVAESIANVEYNRIVEISSQDVRNYLEAAE